MTRRCRFSSPDASLSEFSQVNVEVAKLCSRDLFLGFDQRETPDAEDLCPKAYEPVLLRLLDVISERLGPEVSEALLRAAGSSLAEGHIAPLDDTYARLEVAVNVFNELGGLAELEERDGVLVIRGHSCPLAAVTPDHPEVYRMAETLITELAGVPVYERCDRGERPRCCFEVASSGGAEQK